MIFLKNRFSAYYDALPTNIDRNVWDRSFKRWEDSKLFQEGNNSERRKIVPHDKKSANRRALSDDFVCRYRAVILNKISQDASPEEKKKYEKLDMELYQIVKEMGLLPLEEVFGISRVRTLVSTVVQKVRGVLLPRK
jgi:hypothetical protein